VAVVGSAGAKNFPHSTDHIQLRKELIRIKMIS